MGDKETKLEQLRYGFRGQIPDGLLFRVSSITRDADEGYELQNGYLKEMISAIPNDVRLRIAGISSYASHQ